jgi:hypothetical protein
VVLSGGKTRRLPACSLRASIRNFPTTNASSGAGINFSGGTHALNGGASIIGAGSVGFYGATVNADGSALASTGQVSLSSGALNITGDNNFTWVCSSFK